MAEIVIIGGEIHSIIDGFQSVIFPADKVKLEVLQPIRRIQDATADLGVTGVILHHTTKSVYGGNAVIASSGSAAIPAAFDQTILMNWLKPVSDQSTQTDKRIAISCMGRGISSTIVAELTDNKLISHGDGEEAIRAEKISELSVKNKFIPIIYLLIMFGAIPLSIILLTT